MTKDISSPIIIIMEVIVKTDLSTIARSTSSSHIPFTKHLETIILMRPLGLVEADTLAPEEIKIADLHQIHLEIRHLLRTRIVTSVSSVDFITKATPTGRLLTETALTTSERHQVKILCPSSRPDHLQSLKSLSNV